ncbi:hypothetical protein NIES267_03050 [Calothrix parasitica NIES-267]|uniref:Uncharacterized protein n=1 Tax=Calothrix parasitica NIES-267 TaxID=1973488 RepID=A0A1Z4LHX1_9CYAN|nr:hypothetical protein NIES267_03050 [Calothrix parasitica NIES-267]
MFIANDASKTSASHTQPNKPKLHITYLSIYEFVTMIQMGHFLKEQAVPQSPHLTQAVA